MLLHLQENAESSLMIGLEFYDKYLNSEFEDSLLTYYGNFKYAIIGIHNSVELFIKKLLSEVNELLIYKKETIDNPDILKYIGKKYKQKKKTHLDYYLATYGDDFFTISFKECLSRFKSCFEINENDIKVLSKINQYRNVLTHFGLEDIYKQDKIVYTLNDTLRILNRVIFPLINTKKQYIEQDCFNIINEFLNKNTDKFYEVWEASNESIINYYINKISETINQNNEFEKILGTKEIFCFDGKELILKGSKKSIKLLIEDLPEKNISTILLDSKVIAIMDYEDFNEEKVFLYCPNKYDKDFDDIKNLKSCNWRNTNNHQYDKIPLNPKSFINNILNKCE